MGSSLAKSLLKWALAVTGGYLLGLAAWVVAGKVYLHILAGNLSALAAIGLLPPGSRPLAVPGMGVAVLSPWSQSIAVPQGVLSADLALAGALLLASVWLGWRQRLRVFALGMQLVFAGHVLTVLAQVWLAESGPGASVGTRALWDFYTTLYQGKVLPLLVWGGLAGPALLKEALISPRRPAMPAPTR